jgi:hypothetical protein
MATPTAPGTTVGETQTAGVYTWEWNGSAWDLVTVVPGVWWGAKIKIGWNLVAVAKEPTSLDYV